FVAGGEGGEVVGPPEPFEGCDDVHAAEFAFGGEARGVGDAVEGFDGVAVAVGGVGVAASVDAEVGELGHVDEGDLAGAWRVEAGVGFLDVVALHGSPRRRAKRYV